MMGTKYDCQHLRRLVELMKLPNQNFLKAKLVYSCNLRLRLIVSGVVYLDALRHAMPSEQKYKELIEKTLKDGLYVTPA